MIEELSIRDYAIIQSLTIRFKEGLNILSGETGAGKSILIGALGLVLGEKAESDAIRTGAEQSMVTGTFRIEEGALVREWLAEKDIELDDDSLIIRRVVKKSGRGSIFVQSVPVVLQDLRELSALLVDVHGQHEHQSLFNLESHRRAVDVFAGHLDLLGSYVEEFLELSKIKKQLQDLELSERDRLRNQDLYSFALSEIEGAALKKDEESVLEQEQKILGNFEHLHSSLSKIRGLAHGPEGILSQLDDSLKEMAQVCSVDTSMEESRDRLQSNYYEIEDIFETIRLKADSIEFDPSRLEQIEERIAQIQKLKKKYGATIEEVLQYAEECREKLTITENVEEETKRLKERFDVLQKSVLEKARILSARREETAQKLGKKIETILHILGMKKAGFEIVTTKKTSDTGAPLCGPSGMDSVEFRFSANQGEPLRPLKKIASGGELSRVMLAIKSVLSDADSVPTLIFDEIDTGIGGEVALAVGEHLQKLASRCQILCITHIASIAARGDHNFKVEKKVENHHTYTDIRTIVAGEKVAEIARMLSGDDSSNLSIEHAKELIAKLGS